MPDTSHILLLTALGIASATTLMTLRIAKMSSLSAERTVAELRLAQITALLLVMVSSAYLGFAALLENRLGGGLDVVLAVGFLIVAITATLREPREALTILSRCVALSAASTRASTAGSLRRDALNWEVDEE